MKKIAGLTLAIVLTLSLVGCKQQELPSETVPAVTESTGATEHTEPPEITQPQTTVTKVTEPKVTAPATEPTEETESTEAMEETRATEPPAQQKPKEEEKKQDPPQTKPTDQPATEATEPATKPTDPPETQPAETKPPETQPPATEPPSTEPPETKPTEPEETEPVGCQHDWICIHHAEEGHWIAGIACDCGWTVYGNPEELVAKWNAHSASYPPTESLFDHGGYGSVDEWIVDKPASDEWVCRHCGEAKE